MRYNTKNQTGKFYRIPQVLFVDPRYRKLSSNAKVIYSILSDRMALSIANNHIDKNGDIYFTFDEEKLSNLSGISKRTLSSVRKSLVEVGLLEVAHTGRANIYYLHYAETTPEIAREMMLPQEMDDIETVPERSEDGTFKKSETRNAKIADLDEDEGKTPSNQASNQISKNCISEKQKLQANYTESIYTDDDEKNKYKNTPTDPGTQLEKNLRIVKAYLVMHDVAEKDTQEILQALAQQQNLIHGDAINQQMRRTIQTAKEEGIWSFSSYFLQGLAQIVGNRKIDNQTDIQQRLAESLKVDQEKLPTVSLFNWAAARS